MIAKQDKEKLSTTSIEFGLPLLFINSTTRPLVGPFALSEILG